MIYGTNRIASIGEVEVDVNESYFGAGSLFFVQECAEDELALFEMAIKSDIDEVVVGESAYELEALNENFAESAVNKIKEIMKKFKEWIVGFMRSKLAALTNFIVRDNAKFVKAAKSQISKLKGTKHTVKCKYLDAEGFNKILDAAEKVAKIKEAKDIEKAEYVEGADDMKLEDIIKEEKELDYSEVARHLDWLAERPNTSVKTLKKSLKAALSNADKFVKDAEKSQRENKEDNKKEELAAKVKAATKYRDYTHKVCTLAISAIKNAIKIARRVVTMFISVGAKNKDGVATKAANEAVLVEAMLEADEFELDEELEQMSEAEELDLDEIEDEE